MLRNLVFACVVLTTLATAAPAQVHVDGHVRRDGTYVPPHYRSSPNGTTLDNWSTRGNVNPYTGQYGTRDPYALPQRRFLTPYEAGYLPRGR